MKFSVKESWADALSHPDRLYPPGGAGLNPLTSFPFFAHLARAALLALSFRCAAVSFRARAFPPTKPPARALAERASGVITLARRLANATAAGFFRFAMRHKHISVTSARQNLTQTSQIFGLRFVRTSRIENVPSKPRGLKARRANVMFYGYVPIYDPRPKTDDVTDSVAVNVCENCGHTCETLIDLVDSKSKPLVRPVRLEEV
jgi:hypothetical protein